MVKIPEERRAYDNARYAANRQKIRDQRNARRAADPQKFRDQDNARYAAYPQKYRYRTNAFSQTTAGKKSMTKSSWRKERLIDSDNDNYEKLYQIYIITTHCNSCIAQFTDSFDRCMDRDHDTGLFRQIICQSCNRFDAWKKFIDKPEDGVFINCVSIR